MASSEEKHFQYQFTHIKLEAFTAIESDSLAVKLRFWLRMLSKQFISCDAEFLF